ncbi:MAG: hypothetical protein M3O46_14685 [Myxococcota bacterium]|nr:hypothetical protein [Myxococcota bacterium]
MAPSRSHLHGFLIAAALVAARNATAQSPPPSEGPVGVTPGTPPLEPVPGNDRGGAVGPTEPTPRREELPTTRVISTEREDSGNPFRQSVLIFDQSMTTQTAGLGPTPQSYVPLYEIWVSFRPRYYFDEHWSLRGRFDYTKELTNNQPTTLYREDVFGDIWTALFYTTKVDRLWHGTRAAVGLRALWPTSKVSQANGTYVTPGVTAGAEHWFEINGEGASVLNDFRVRASVAYLKPLTSGTTPTHYGQFAYTRQDVEGFSFISDQIVGQTLPEHTLWAVVDAILQVTPRFSLTTDLIAINQWHYAPTPTALVRQPSYDNQFTQNIWFIAQMDYALFDEVDLSLGYYNLANYVAPSGQARSLFGPDNIWWSPDARLFFDVTANLDILFDDANRHKYLPKQAQRGGDSRQAGQWR